jgi:hypothetical protein
MPSAIFAIPEVFNRLECERTPPRRPPFDGALRVGRPGGLIRRDLRGKRLIVCRERQATIGAPRERLVRPTAPERKDFLGARQGTLNAPGRMRSRNPPKSSDYELNGIVRRIFAASACACMERLSIIAVCLPAVVASTATAPYSSAEGKRLRPLAAVGSQAACTRLAT